ncbi:MULTISPECIES: N-acetyl-1-D-myo-inositol-2-amino-2-deoxy-alpha-D-glucopyranoside deacetylase [unclassified Kitasatospora]|uniref:N-acetyl-1-D-myo-inositol-2-amino-2-deoxy-alpha- D-glucopyranoside deacetylase n=1 Tax=unclassified Kitasatospora TaxID=2633591 RepID=UPI0033EF5C16
MTTQPTTATGTPTRSGSRILLVHAHPDDESIANGATMARYAAEGATVTLITCTLGEEGEVIGPDLAHLTSDREDRLGPHRAQEIAAALRELGVTDHRFLGGPGRYRDSGMMGSPGNDRPDSFWQADPDEAAGHLVEVIREIRPQVLVTYDPDGGYRHPDHIQAHRVAMRAAALAADPAYRPESGTPHGIAKIYWNCVPRSVVDAGAAALHTAGANAPFPAAAGHHDIPRVVEDDAVTTVVDGSAHLDRKRAAMAAHATQITVADPFFALSNNLAQPLSATEYYQLAQGEPGPSGPSGREEDLFAAFPSTGP